MKLAWSDLTSMDYQFKNGRGFIDPHQSRYVDMSQLTGSGLEDMDFWADCFNDGMTRDAPNATMLSEDLKTGKRPSHLAFLNRHAAHMSSLKTFVPPALCILSPTLRVLLSCPPLIHAIQHSLTHVTIQLLATSKTMIRLVSREISSPSRPYMILPMDRLARTMRDSLTATMRQEMSKHHLLTDSSDFIIYHHSSHWHEASPLRCQWKDCGSNDTFSNEGSLVRHLKAKHISPEKYRCPCRKSFGRKDRFRDHMRLKHPELGHGICNKCHEC